MTTTNGNGAFFSGVEASTLGWEAGRWPIVFVDGKGHRYERKTITKDGEGDVLYVEYFSVQAAEKVRVFND